MIHLPECNGVIPYVTIDGSINEADVCICKQLRDCEDRVRREIASVNSVSVARGAMDTSRKAAANVLPRSGTMKSMIYNLICFRNGLTDDEIERQTGMAHQSASAARRGLVLAGLVIDSGERRKNRRGNDSAVWIKAGNNDRSSSSNSRLGDASSRQSGTASITSDSGEMDGFWIRDDLGQYPKVDS